MLAHIANRRLMLGTVELLSVHELTKPTHPDTAEARLAAMAKAINEAVAIRSLLSGEQRNAAETVDVRWRTMGRFEGVEGT